jgi:hypothetical protein
MVVIPRNIGVIIKVTVDIITALLPPPSLRVNNPRIKIVAELINAGSNRMTKSESPKKNFQTQFNNLLRKIY